MKGSNQVICIMEIIKSNKGGLKLCLDGYMYTKHHTKSSFILWTTKKKSEQLFTKDLQERL